MLINFNIDKLDKLLYDFYQLTGLTISVWNADFRQLSYQPKGMRTFCRMIKSTPKGRERCLLSDMTVCKACAVEGRPASHHCHAGLVDTAVPIRFKDTVLGYLMFGQIKDGTTDNTALLAELSRELDMDMADLMQSYEELEVFNQEAVDAAANILKMATRYLWLSEYIDIGYNSVASRLDDYIRAHLADDISVASICRDFGVSKNRLYEIAHESFDHPIGEHIARARIDEAKRLLSATDTPVHEVAALVGIADYNYFTKFFKARVGVAPLKYRKNFPFTLYDGDGVAIE